MINHQHQLLRPATTTVTNTDHRTTFTTDQPFFLCTNTHTHTNTAENHHQQYSHLSSALQILEWIRRNLHHNNCGGGASGNSIIVRSFTIGGRPVRSFILKFLDRNSALCVWTCVCISTESILMQYHRLQLHPHWKGCVPRDRCFYFENSLFLSLSLSRCAYRYL